jgi:hypothetical protein
MEKEKQAEYITCATNNPEEDNRRLVVVFNGLYLGNEGWYDFKNTLKRINVKQLFIKDYSKSWFLRPFEYCHQFLKKLQEEHAGYKIYFMGNSIGGYASILFGSLLDIHKAISFCPQTVLDIEHHTKDCIWYDALKDIQEMRRVYPEYFDLRKRLRNYNGKTQFDIYFSSDSELDEKMAMFIKEHPNVRTCDMYTSDMKEYGGHSVCRYLAKSGKLVEFLNSRITED